MDGETYRKSTSYTLTNNAFGMVNTIWDAVVLIIRPDQAEAEAIDAVR